MTAPALDPVAADLYGALAPLAATDDRNGYALASLTAAVGAMFQAVDTLARDTPAGPGWSELLDVDRDPPLGLGYLAQFVGVTLDPALGDTAQRARIRATDGFKRGTVAAIVGAARQYLTGMQRVVLVERVGGDAYALTVITYTSETPDAAKVLAAMTAQKPAGLLLTHTVLSGQTFAQLKANYATFAAAKAHYSTFAALRDDNP